MALITPPNIGIDLGTSNTLVHVKGKGIVIDEPTLLVVEKTRKRGPKLIGGGSVPLAEEEEPSSGRRSFRESVCAVGAEALRHLGRTAGDIYAVRPMADGMIRDFEMTQYMLEHFLRKAVGASRLVRPRCVITIPCRVSPIERRAVRQAAVNAGVRPTQLNFLEKPFAAAMGTNLPVFEPVGSMIVDIGGGTTEVAVISLGGIVIGRSIRIGGVKMDEAVISYLRREFNMLIGDRTAEEVKITLGSALELREERRVSVRGRDMITNLPQTAEITSSAIYRALQPPCEAILAAIHYVLEHTPPELTGDILKNGIYMTGGGSMLFGLDQYISGELGIPVRIAKDPLQCAAQGVGKVADHPELMEQIFRNNYLSDEKEEKES